MSAASQVASEWEYVIVTPAFNEEENLQQTIDSVVAQTCRPSAWVLVDDGSTDGTAEIVRSAAQMHPWIHAICRQKKSSSDVDGLLIASEAEAFLVGFEEAKKHCDPAELGFIVKLDADLAFGPGYFEELFECFGRSPKLGIAGGSIYEKIGDSLVKEAVSPIHVRGATKVYRVECYEDIGGLRPVFGWDVADELLARSKGWEVRPFDPPALVHLRPTATRDGQFRGWTRHGQMAHHLGFSTLRVAARILYRALVLRKPVQAAGLARGYFGALLSRAPRIADHDIRRAIHDQQWKFAS